MIIQHKKYFQRNPEESPQVLWCELNSAFSFILALCVFSNTVTQLVRLSVSKQTLPVYWHFLWWPVSEERSTYAFCLSLRCQYGTCEDVWPPLLLIGKLKGRSSYLLFWSSLVLVRGRWNCYQRELQGNYNAPQTDKNQDCN